MLDSGGRHEGDECLLSDPRRLAHQRIPEKGDAMGERDTLGEWRVAMLELHELEGGQQARATVASVFDRPIALEVDRQHLRAAQVAREARKVRGGKRRAVRGGRGGIDSETVGECHGLKGRVLPKANGERMTVGTRARSVVGREATMRPRSTRARRGGAVG